MGINDLPSPGINFRATTGVGNFQKKLSSATRYGDLKNLKNNQKAIVGAISQPTTLRAIRRGGLSRLQQLGVWSKIKASDKTVTKEDKREIKEVLKHLSRGAVANAKKMAITAHAVKTSDGKSFLTPEQVERNLNRSRRMGDESGVGVGEYSKRYAGGNEVKSYGVRGTMKDIGVKRGNIGFAGNYQNSNLPEKPMPTTPPAGTRPVGL